MNELSANRNLMLSNPRFKGDFQSLFGFQCVQGMNAVLSLENEMRTKTLQLMGEKQKSAFFEDKYLLNVDSSNEIKNFLEANLKNLDRLKIAGLKIYKDGSDEIETLNSLLRRFSILFEKINKLKPNKKYKKAEILTLEAELRGLLTTYKEIFKSEKAGLISIA
ncbi:MAG: hypothetical protein KC589_09470 [Nanoarchaeota archaeon]|nr:hypothetical protein [Nanoarchaeota archaeon]